MSTYDSKKLQRPHPHSYILPFTLIFVFDIFIFRHFYVSTFLLSTKVGITVFFITIEFFYETEKLIKLSTKQESLFETWSSNNYLSM